MSEHATLLPALLISASLVTATACTAESPEADDRSIIFEQASPNVAPSKTTTPTGESVDPAEFRRLEVIRLLGQQAGINIIYIPLKNPNTPDPADSQVTVNDEFRTQLLRSDKSLLQSLITTVDTATYGRYHPKSVGVQKAIPVDLANNCIDQNDPAKVIAVEQIASSFSDPNKINIVALDAAPCDRSLFMGTAGYGSVEITPVITQLAFSVPDRFNTAFPSTVAHELGHHAGLKHAGKAACKEALEIRDCTVAVTRDQNSIMSYERDNLYVQQAYRFTAPELNAMGLLKSSEVITNPAPGTTRLSSMEHKGVKLVVLQEKGDDPRYLSYEMDPYAAYDIACDTATKKNLHDSVLYSSVLGNKDYVCFKSAETGHDASLQVRFPVRPEDTLSGNLSAGNDSLAMVDVRKDSTQKSEPRNDASVTDGYVTKAVVLRDAQQTVTFTGVSRSGEAMISITK